jgi:hypothetical protein
VYVQRIAARAGDIGMQKKRRLFGLLDTVYEKATLGGVVLRPGMNLRLEGSGTRFDGVYYVDKAGREDADGGAYRSAFVLVRPTREDP